MKIFGNILPFIGFRTFSLFSDGHPDVCGILKNPEYESDCFMFEWFGHGVILFTTSVRKIKGEKNGK